MDPQTEGMDGLTLIAPNHVEASTGRLLSLETAGEQGAESGKYRCDKGDVIYSKIRPALRKVTVAPLDCLCSADMYPLKGCNGLSNRFLYWYLLSEPFSDFAHRESMRVAMPKLNRETLASATVPVPGLDEQDSIANFLDDKTARIDALIAQKVRLLELLVEQRLSVVERVLAPAAHEGQVKLGFHVDLLPGFAFPSEEFSRDPDDVPLLRGVNVSPAALRWDDAVYWRRDYDSSLERFKLVAGDVVFGMDRPWISSGVRVAVVDKSSEGALLLQRVCRLRGGSKFHQRFLYYALASDAFRQSVEVELTGVSVPHISPEQILRFKVPALTIEEQSTRCALADDEVMRIESLEALTTEMLEALREYRSSLISAAVTGQMDVASLHASEQEAA